MKQSLEQKLLHKLSPQRIQLMSFIQMPTLDFEMKIKEELEDNVALVEDEEGEEQETLSEEVNNENSEDAEPDYDVDDFDDYINHDDDWGSDSFQYKNNQSEDEKNYFQIADTSSYSLYNSLSRQLDIVELNEHQYSLADYLIGCIDDDGYMRTPLQNIVNDLAFSQGISTTLEEVEQILNIVQSFDPPGVGGRDLQECLMLQLCRKSPTPEIEFAIKLIKNDFESLAKKHYQKIIQRYNISEQELSEIFDVIDKLNPKPGAALSSGKPVEIIVPDFFITIGENDQIFVDINRPNRKSLFVSRQYNSILQNFKNQKQRTKKDRETIHFIKQKIDSAKWFIDAVQQREQTLLMTMSEIVNQQREYFLTGNQKKIKPMILQDIAEKIDMDISTVSRVARSKYAATPYGTVYIKDLFSEAITTDQGEDVSNIKVKKIIESIVEEEDKSKPLTDAEICDMMKERGYPLARRTVAKYREQLNIPVSRLRKELIT